LIRKRRHAGVFCIELLAVRKFFTVGYKVSSDKYVTSINSGVNVTGQRGTPK